MRVYGILEASLYVADPMITAAFYRRLFGFATGTRAGLEPARRP